MINVDRAQWLNSWIAMMLLFTACRGQPQQQPAEEIVAGWRWSDERVAETVAAVRAGRSLQPDAWPNGADVAVLLAFDVDNETIPLRYGEPTIGALSQGEYGGRVALPRILELLDRHQIPASFFIPAVSLVLQPEMTAAIQRAGTTSSPYMGGSTKPTLRCRRGTKEPCCSGQSITSPRSRGSDRSATAHPPGTSAPTLLT